MVCSHWADQLPSAVTTVQRSLRVRQALLPALRIGSTARVMPERNFMLGRSLVRKLNTDGSSCRLRPTPWPV